MSAQESFKNCKNSLHPICCIQFLLHVIIAFQNNTQCILGLLLLALSFLLPSLIESANITPIAALLFGCIFLITVQDIAVDGWCLTLLTEDCVGAAANCQVVGQGLGALSYNLYFSVMVPFFELPFTTYLKGKYGLESRDYKIYSNSVIGFTYIVASVVVLVLIRERNDPELANSCLNVKDSYVKLFKLLTLRAIQIWPSLPRFNFEVIYC